MKCSQQWPVGIRTCFDSGKVGESGPVKTENEVRKSLRNQNPVTVLFKAPLVVVMCLFMPGLSLVWDSEHNSPFSFPLGCYFWGLACSLLGTSSLVADDFKYSDLLWSSPGEASGWHHVLYNPWLTHKTFHGVLFTLKSSRMHPLIRVEIRNKCRIQTEAFSCSPTHLASFV